MPERRSLRPGDPELLGAYRLIGLLGEGGQGVVYLGRRLETESEVTKDTDGARGELFAIKLLRTHLSGDDRARRYFAREVAAAQRIDPSYTARIVEADVEGRTPYLVSEYVDGRPLSDAVRADGPLSGAALHRLAVGTLNALIAIHQANVVHRDFKPSNVLLSADRPRVIDFGLARALDSTMSMTSGVVGTPAYMAPEQLNGQQVTPAVDVFAWASTMVFAATGAPPFGQDSIPPPTRRWHAWATPSRPRPARPGAATRTYGCRRTRLRHSSGGSRFRTTRRPGRRGRRAAAGSPSPPRPRASLSWPRPLSSPCTCPGRIGPAARVRHRVARPVRPSTRRSPRWSTPPPSLAARCGCARPPTSTHSTPARCTSPARGTSAASTRAPSSRTRASVCARCPTSRAASARRAPT